MARPRPAYRRAPFTAAPRLPPRPVYRCAKEGVTLNVPRGPAQAEGRREYGSLLRDTSSRVPFGTRRREVARKREHRTPQRRFSRTPSVQPLTRLRAGIRRQQEHLGFAGAGRDDHALAHTEFHLAGLQVRNHDHEPP